MERPTLGTRGGVDDVAASYASTRAPKPSPALFFAPFVAHGWRFIADGQPGPHSFASMTIVAPGYERVVAGTNAKCMTPDRSWFDLSSPGVVHAMKACGLMISKRETDKDVIAREKHERINASRGRQASVRLNLRDHVAIHLNAMVSALVALRVSATVYRHRRWAFECFREVYRRTRELKFRLRNSKVSALGKDSYASLRELIKAFDDMMHAMCAFGGDIRREFYDGVVTCPWDIDHEWQRNPHFSDELFDVPYAQADHRDITMSKVCADAAKGADLPRHDVRETASSQGSQASEQTDDAGVACAKRQRRESVDSVTRQCRVKPLLEQIPAITALAMAAEVDIVAGAVAHFFETCDLCVQGPTFQEYLTVVTSAYDFSFANEMVTALENYVVPHMQGDAFPDEIAFYYQRLLEQYRGALDIRERARLVSEDPNPLLHVVLMQTIEGVLIMAKDGPECDITTRYDELMRQYADAMAAAHHKRTEFSHAASHSECLPVSLPPAPCPAPIERWRTACRQWTTRIYAPAVPSFEAIRALKDASPSEGWREAGARRAQYWVAVLCRCGVKMFDEPEASRSAEASEDINADDDDKADDNVTGMLFCCEPRDGDVAIEHLRDSRVDSIAVVGEWQGSTAGSRFLRRLSKRFNLVKTISLPNWSDSTHELSIWKRRKRRLSKSKRAKYELTTTDVFPNVQRCRVAGCETWSSSSTMFCCRLCRSAFVCENHLAALHDDWDVAHSIEHALRLLPKVGHMSGYDVKLTTTESGEDVFRSESIMAFNPFRHEAEFWNVDYARPSYEGYSNVRLSMPRVEVVENWK